MNDLNGGAQDGEAVRCSAWWLGGLRYFVMSGPMPPSTVYRLQPDGEIEMMLTCGWSASVTNQMTGLHEVSEGAARFIWERLFQPPNDQAQRLPPGAGVDDTKNL